MIRMRKYHCDLPLKKSILAQARFTDDMLYLLVARLLRNIRFIIRFCIYLQTSQISCREMDKISNIKITDCDDSLYIKPIRMLYEQDGRPKSWDLMKIHDSVGIIIFNITRQVLIFVKQFRPAVYCAEVKVEDMDSSVDTQKYPSSLGMTIELCAGIVDKPQSLVETARDEVLEECGYDVPLSSFQKVTTYRIGVGVTGSHQSLYYVEVTDAMKVSEGGGNVSEGEYIEVIEMDLTKAYSLIYDETVARPASMILALMWFFQNKVPSKINQKL